MQHTVSAQDLADALNGLRLADPMWQEGGFRVRGRWLEIDPDASDELAAQLLGCDLDTARQRNEEEARWLVAGGVGVTYGQRHGWRPAKYVPKARLHEAELADGPGDDDMASQELAVG
jgi:hypothetical protein